MERKDVANCIAIRKRVTTLNRVHSGAQDIIRNWSKSASESESI